jgi:hypothetical protein
MSADNIDRFMASLARAVWGNPDDYSDAEAIRSRLRPAEIAARYPTIAVLLFA